MVLFYWGDVYICCIGVLIINIVEGIQFVVVDNTEAIVVLLCIQHRGALLMLVNFLWAGVCGSCMHVVLVIGLLF